MFTSLDAELIHTCTLLGAGAQERASELVAQGARPAAPNDLGLTAIGAALESWSWEPLRDILHASPEDLWFSTSPSGPWLQPNSSSLSATLSLHNPRMPLLEVQARDARLALIIEHALKAPASCALEERIKALSLAACSGLTRCFSLLAHASESCGWGAGAKQLRWVVLSAPAPYLESGRLACFDTAYDLGWDLGALYDLSPQSKKITSSLLACAHLGFGSTEAAHDSQGILDGLDARCRHLIELGVPAVFYYPNALSPASIKTPLWSPRFDFNSEACKRARQCVHVLRALSESRALGASLGLNPRQSFKTQPRL